MRIIAGEFGGRILREPRGRVAHPMGERVRQGVFNALFDVEGRQVLDAFAGSGALAIEAVSRGAESALAIEIDFKVYEVLRENIETLGLRDRVKISRANVFSFLSSNPQKFDLIFVDPPYQKFDRSIPQRLTQYLETSGVMVVSHPATDQDLQVPDLILKASYNYAGAKVSIFEKR